MEKEGDLISCTNCPEEPGRFCTPYIGGKTRLVFRPLPVPVGLKKYYEGYKSPESINDCPIRQKAAINNGIPTNATS